MAERASEQEPAVAKGHIFSLGRVVSLCGEQGGWPGKLEARRGLRHDGRAGEGRGEAKGIQRAVEEATGTNASLWLPEPRTSAILDTGRPVRLVTGPLEAEGVIHRNNFNRCTSMLAGSYVHADALGPSVSALSQHVIDSTLLKFGAGFVSPLARLKPKPCGCDKAACTYRHPSCSATSFPRQSPRSWR